MITQAQKELWIDNLTNGKYQQAFGRLRVIDYLRVKDEHFCPLGVLVHQNFGVVFASEGHYQKDFPELSHGTFTWIVQEIGNDNAREIMVLNDDLKCSFPQIAKWIKEHVRAAPCSV